MPRDGQLPWGRPASLFISKEHPSAGGRARPVQLHWCQVGPEAAPPTPGPRFAPCVWLVVSFTPDLPGCREALAVGCPVRACVYVYVMRKLPTLLRPLRYFWVSSKALSMNGRVTL